MNGTVLAFLLGMIPGSVLGGALFIKGWVDFEFIESYKLVLVGVSIMVSLVAGYFAGKKTQPEQAPIRPQFQGKPQSLAQDGDKIVNAALQRAGVVKRKE